MKSFMIVIAASVVCSLLMMNPRSFCSIGAARLCVIKVLSVVLSGPPDLSIVAPSLVILFF